MPELARLGGGGSPRARAAVADGTAALSLEPGPRWLEGAGADPATREGVERLFARLFAALEDVSPELAGHVDVAYEDCGEPGSSYDAATRTVTLCEELVEGAYEAFVAMRRERTGRAPSPVELVRARRAAYDFLGFALYHELGHALHALGRVPGTEPVESAADAVAAVLLVESGRGRDVLAAAALVAGQSAEREALHGDGVARGTELLCLAFGGDAAVRAEPDVPPSVRETYLGREPSCADAYATARDRVAARLGSVR